MAESEVIKELEWIKKLSVKNHAEMSTRENSEAKKMMFDFVLNCPAEGKSKYTKYFKDYGICGSKDYNLFKKTVLDQLKLINGVSYGFYDNCNDKYKIMCANTQELYEKKIPFIFFTQNSDNNEIESFFIRIRNAFAHGNFLRKERGYYLIWNEYLKKINLVMLLRKRQLDMIIEELQNFYRDNAKD